MGVKRVMECRPKKKEMVENTFGMMGHDVVGAFVQNIGSMDKKGKGVN